MDSFYYGAMLTLQPSPAGDSKAIIAQKGSLEKAFVNNACLPTWFDLFRVCSLAKKQAVFIEHRLADKMCITQIGMIPIRISGIAAKRQGKRSKVQATSSLGRHCSTISISTIIRIFNPRSPRGERQQKCMFFMREFIHIP